MCPQAFPCAFNGRHDGKKSQVMMIHGKAMGMPLLAADILFSE